MDRLYSLTLAAAIALAAAALVGLVVATLAVGSPRLASIAWRASGLAARASLALALVSAGVHLAAGHGPGSPGALGPVGFAREHPALVVVLLLAALAWWISRRAAGGPDGRVK